MANTESPPTGVCLYLPPAWPQGSTTGAEPGARHGLSGARVGGEELTSVAVILSARLGVNIHRPELLGKDVLGGGGVTVALPEASLVRVRGVAGDGGSRDGAMVVGMPGVGEAVGAANGAALGPPEAGLATPTLLPGRPQLTGTIVGTGAGSRLGRAVLEPIS